MKELVRELERTIVNLEKIRDTKKRPSKKLTLALDALYQKQLDLIAAAIENATEEYGDALKAMKCAAKETRAAIQDLAKLDKALKKVAVAVALVGKWI